MEDPNLRKVSHIGLWILVLAIGGWLVWSATHASTENTKNLPGSIDNHKEAKYYGLLSMGISGCEYPVGVEGRPNVKDSVTNSVYKH